MGDVLIDSCGWVALVDGGFNIDTSLSKLVGPPHFVLLDLVLDELEAIDESRSRGNKLMLDLLLQRSTQINYEASHTDDALIEIAKERGIPILTVDAKLKHRSLENCVAILEVLQGKNIRLINGV